MNGDADPRLPTLCAVGAADAASAAVGAKDIKSTPLPGA